MNSCCEESLSTLSLQWSKKHSIGIVMASDGYPGSFTTGLPVTGAYKSKFFLLK